MSYRNPFEDDPVPVTPPAASPAAVVAKPAANPFDDGGRASPRTTVQMVLPPPAPFSATFDEFAVLSPQQQRPPAQPLDLSAAFHGLNGDKQAAPQPQQHTQQQSQEQQQPQPQGSLLPGPKAAGRTLRRSQLPPDLRERSKSIETKKMPDLASIFHPAPVNQAPLSPRASSEPPPPSHSPPPPSSGSFLADFSRAPATAVAAPTAVFRFASSVVCNGLRGAARADPQSFALGEELVVRAEATGFRREAGGVACQLVCRYKVARASGQVLLEAEHVTRTAPALGSDLVELGVAVPLMFEESAAGPCVLQLSVTDALAGEEVAAAAKTILFSHAFVLRGWSWGLHQAKLLVEQRPLQVPAVFPFQEVSVSAIVTIDKAMQGPPEAFFSVRDAATGATVVAEPQSCALIPHPRLPCCFALLASLSLAKPGAYLMMVAAKHAAQPTQLLRCDLQFAVVHFL